MLVGAAWFFLIMEHEAPRELPLMLFALLTGAVAVFCLLSGVQTTADCLSREKREGTFGLLFLTDLKGYDVVLGKLAATSINVFYTALAAVPLLAIPLLLGGVTLGEFGRMALVVLNTLFLSLSVGVCISAMCRDARKAMGCTFLVLTVITVLFPALSAWLNYLGKPPWLWGVMLLPSPGFSYVMAFEASPKPVPHGFLTSMLVVLGLGWVFLGLASLLAPHSWQDRPAGVRRLRWRERLQLWSYGPRSERDAFRRSLLNVNAFFWLTARARLKPAFVWGLLGLLGVGWLWALFKWRSEWLSEPTYILTGIVLNLLIKGWFTAECGRQLADDRQQGALELLLSTPLTVRDFLVGQRLALQRQFLGPTLFVIVIELSFMFGTKPDMVAESERGLWPCLWAGSVIMLLADLVALYWVGLWQALAARNPNRAATNAVVRILVVPWALYALVMLFVVLASIIGVRAKGDPGWRFFLGLWFILGIGTDVAFALAARFQFLTQFRQVAAKKYVPRESFWKSLLGS